jgi:integrase/recombinase XerD
MGKLHDQMLMEMELRNFSPKTIKAYLWNMKAYTRHFMKSPTEMGETEIKQYLHYLKVVKKVSYSNINIAYSALRFFYVDTLHREWQVEKIPRPKVGRKLPVVLSREALQKLFAATPNLKHRVILMTTYSAGLRVSEVAHLKITDIDSQRMQIRVEQGKGQKDRYTLLSKELLPELRDYYLQYKPTTWLFEGKGGNVPLSVGTIQKIFKTAKTNAGIHQPATVHTLRHCFATHLLEDGTDIFTLRELLGHKSIHTTLRYIHIQRDHIQKVVSPLDRMGRDGS